MWGQRSIGHGIGLRTKHFPHLAENPPTGVDWFEVISENFFEPGGRPWRILDRVRSAVPVVMHGVSLGIGNSDDLRPAYLASLRSLMERLEPAWVSDHLCWGAFGGHQAHDLLPLPYTQEAITHIVPRILRVQDHLQRRILLENVSSYVTFRESEMTEWEFLAQIVERADCGILLDVNNIYVSAYNHGFSIDSYLEGIPRGRVGQFHLAGHTPYNGYILDSHIGPIIEGVWEVYRKALHRFGPIPTLIEWDEEIPPYEEVVAESQRARQIEAALLRLPDALPQPPSSSQERTHLGQQAAFSQERTHLGLSKASSPQAPSPSPVHPFPPHLRRIQKFFWDFVRAPEGVEAAKTQPHAIDPESVPLQSWLAGESEAFATQRLDIYASMYFYRLLDSLKADFPKVEAILGEAGFHNLITDYLLIHPSENPSLRYLGERLPSYLAEHPTRDEYPYLADLARLEWARIEVFDRPFHPVLEAAILQTIPAEAWGEIVFTPIPALRLLDLAYPVAPLWLALHQGRSWQPPQPEATSLVVWRLGVASDHQEISPFEASALRALLAGANFGAICALALPPSVSEDDASEAILDDATQKALHLLVTWLQRGFLQDFRLPPSL